jgi:hypothetical protein
LGDDLAKQVVKGFGSAAGHRYRLANIGEEDRDNMLDMAISVANIREHNPTRTT